MRKLLMLGGSMLVLIASAASEPVAAQKVEEAASDQSDDLVSEEEARDLLYGYASGPSGDLDMPEPVILASDAYRTPDEAITITVTGNPSEVEDTGQPVTVIGAEEIADIQGPDLSRVLQRVPGVTINRNGGIGTSTSVSIRGAESDQTVVLIDGVKLNDPSSTGGGFNFGPALTGNIARVEVVRGSQSVLYGSQAIGGVVNLITREPTEELGVFARAEYGERDTAELVGNVSGKFGPVGVSVGGNYYRTDGISAFSEARGGTEPDGFESLGANAKFDIALGENFSIDLRGFYADSETDIDGFTATGLGDTNEVSYRDDLVGYGGINANFLDGRFRNRLGIAYTRVDRRNFSFDTDSETFDAFGENLRYEYQGVFDAADIAELVFGAEREESEYRSSSFGAPAIGDDVWINSVYGQLNLTPLAKSPAHTLSGGERRRAEITRALVISPSFMLLDEPFAGIDPIAVTDIQEIIFHLKARGIGVLITDHNVRETLRITDRAYIVHDGSVFRSGTPAELANDEDVKRIYLGADFRLD